jgi:hypothetical protein
MVLIFFIFVYHSQAFQVIASSSEKLFSPQFSNLVLLCAKLEVENVRKTLLSDINLKLKFS